MSREHSIGETPSSPRSARVRLAWLLSMVAILTCGLWLSLRAPAGQKTADPRGLKLLDSVVHLPTASFKTLELLLPCAGTLAIDIAAQEGSDISVFLVAPDELVKMKAKQTFAHMTGFDANRIRKYRRSERLTAGKYCLVLMDRSPGRLSSSITDIQVGARLSQLE